ncbi:MAG: putative prohead protease [Prokaryotic dsDNA virus sp.]|nr:MAG: putative prohead protease [Prokaryotic dsDNA virus sp.]|tara:strand:- start:1268 stop:1978 length:711 start_codon:yes stop_codon:yes gene_type:complete
MENNIIYKSSPIGELQDIDDKTGIVKGYGSIFGNIDSDGDIITKGAYTKTISENGNRVKYLYQHQMDKPLGKMVNLYEDEKGLMFEAEIPKTQLGKDVLELMKAGVITENSVGILPMQKEGCPDGMENCYRKLTEVKLYEISAVTLAANDEAMILDVKGNFDKEKVLGRYDNLVKLIRKGSISDNLGYAIEAELIKLKSIFNDKATLPTDMEVTEPTTIKADNSEIYKYLFNKLKS